MKVGSPRTTDAAGAGLSPSSPRTGRRKVVTPTVRPKQGYGREESTPPAVSTAAP